METQTVSSGQPAVPAEQRAREEAALQAERMALDTAREQGTRLAKMMETAAPEQIRDPALGSLVDFLA